MKVVTWQTPRGGTLDICRECETILKATRVWPRGPDGQEYCQVSEGAHEGRCHVHAGIRTGLALSRPPSGFHGRVINGVFFLGRAEIARLREEDREAGRSGAYWTDRGPCYTPIPSGEDSRICARCGWSHAPRLATWEVEEILSGSGEVSR